MLMPSLGPQTRAIQPAGFVSGRTLKPHQLEALTLLKRAEARPLGFNSVIWREVNLAGRRWWLSLITGKLSSTEPPKQVTGGILGELLILALLEEPLLFCIQHVACEIVRL